MKYLEDFSFWIQAKTGLDGELFLTRQAGVAVGAHACGAR